MHFSQDLLKYLKIQIILYLHNKPKRINIKRLNMLRNTQL